MSDSHHDTPPSAWVERFAPLVPAGGAVLDVAAGGGRHARLFHDLGHPVTAVDRDISRLPELPRLEAVEADLEDGRRFPFAEEEFAGVVIANYLHRPILPEIVGCVAPEGLLIYETFALGNERFGKPSNPDFLLRPGELLEAVRGRLRVLAYEDLIVETPRPAAVQRIAARNEIKG
jgi:SAM-dependent methyltransferase